MRTISSLKTTFLGVGAAVIFAGGITTGSTAIPAEDEPPDIEPLSANEEVHSVKNAIAEEQYDERVSRALRKKSKALDKADRKIRELKHKLGHEHGSSMTQVSSASFSGESAQDIARRLLAARGWSDQWSCLNSLIMRESGWSVTADNPTSSAYGIPQALPGSKMASAGPDWRTSAKTQLIWMMGYIANRYGTPCGAWGHSQATGWY